MTARIVPPLLSLTRPKLAHDAATLWQCNFLIKPIWTLKHEVLNHLVVVSPRHLNHIGREAVRWYNTERGHSARDNVPPAWDAAPEPVETIKLTDVACSTRLAGLLKHDWRRAA